MTAEAFVYCWTDWETRKLYVGFHKGSPDDGYVCSSKYMRPEYEKRSNTFTREILYFGTHKECVTFETAVIRAMFKMDVPRYNKSVAGQYTHDADVCKKISVSLTGRKGPSPSAETRAKMSASMLGRVITKEHAAKISASKKGVNTVSAEKRAEVSKRRKKHVYTPEERAAVGEFHKGRKRSDLTRARLSASITAWHVKRREAANDT